jgi:hypothetical protein
VPSAHHSPVDSKPTHKAFLLPRSRVARAPGMRDRRRTRDRRALTNTTTAAAAAMATATHPYQTCIPTATATPQTPSLASSLARTRNARHGRTMARPTAHRQIQPSRPPASVLLPPSPIAKLFPRRLVTPYLACNLDYTLLAHAGQASCAARRRRPTNKPEAAFPGPLSFLRFFAAMPLSLSLSLSRARATRRTPPPPRQLRVPFAPGIALRGRPVGACQGKST